jgi:hypothetical protein
MGMSKESLIHLKIASIKGKLVDNITKDVVQLNSQINNVSISTSAVLGAVFAVVIDEYKKHLGIVDTAKMVYYVADDLATKAPPQIKFPQKK